MPWTAKDADSHIKGLSSEQKANWAKIANASLSSCLKGGKDNKFCEGYAIRVANSKVKRTKESNITIGKENIKEDKWTEEFIKSLPDTSFAYVEYRGDKKKRYFPFQDSEGKINVTLLKEALRDVIDKEDSNGKLFGSRAIKILKRAAKKVRIGEYAEDWKGGFGQFQSIVQIDESLLKSDRYKPNDEKKEVVLPLMVEGWGNSKDKNYYTPKAVTEVAHYILGRNKMYLNHPKEGDDSRDIKKWAATVKETWIDKLPDNRHITMGRIKVYDNWLWERFKEAPGEIGTSLLGRGKARDGIVDGKQANIIESIEEVRSCDFVDYPGNTPLGMTYFVESEKFEEDFEDKIKQEDKKMELKDLTMAQIKEGNPELVAEIEQKAIEEKEKSSQTIQEKEVVEKKIKELEKENKELKTKLDEKEVKEKLAEKEKLRDKVLNESKLPETAKTDVFKKILMDCEEEKTGDKIVTVEEQMKSLIDDRLVAIGEKVENPIKESGKSSTKEEEETLVQESFNEGIFGVTKPKEEKK